MINKKNIPIITILIICFILVVCSFYNHKHTLSTKKQEIVKNDSKSLFEKEEYILNGNYNYKFEINDNKKVTYKGSYNNGETKGKYISSDKTYNYIITNKNVYIIKEKGKEPYKDLYSNLDYRLFDFESIFHDIKDKNFIKKIENNKVIYTYDYLDYKLSIITDKESILKIIFKKDNVTYDFSFVRK